MLGMVAYDRVSCACLPSFPTHHNPANEVLIESVERPKSDCRDTSDELS